MASSKENLGDWTQNTNFTEDITADTDTDRMARCKNVGEDKGKEEIPRATFKKKTSRKRCGICQEEMLHSNLARHMRVVHKLVKDSKTDSDRGKVVPPLRVRMSWERPKGSRDEMSVEATVDDEGRLPTTPPSPASLNYELAKLYAKRAAPSDGGDEGEAASTDGGDAGRGGPTDGAGPGRCGGSTISYRLTREMTAVAHNPEQRDSLVEIMEAAGLRLLTQNKLDDLIEGARRRGAVEYEDEMDLGDGPPPRAARNCIMPLIFPAVSPCDGSFGLKITPFKL